MHEWKHWSFDLRNVKNTLLKSLENKYSIADGWPKSQKKMEMESLESKLIENH